MRRLLLSSVPGVRSQSTRLFARRATFTCAHLMSWTMAFKGGMPSRCVWEAKKGVIYDNVRLKIDESYLPELHLDTDDANAADLVVCGDMVFIIK